MADGDRVELVRRFRQGVFDGDEAAIASSLHPDVTWGIGGTSRFNGFHEGRAAVLGVFTAMWDLSRGSFQPAHPESHDIMRSPFHLSLVDRYTGTRGRLILDSYECWVMRDEDGLLKECFHYVHDQESFDSFWW